MVDIYELTDNAIMAQIGLKLKEERVARNISQKELARTCGLSMFSISQIENGHNTSLLSLIMILRTLERLDILSDLFAEKQLSPVAYSEAMKKMQKNGRKHAYRSYTIDNPDRRVAEDFNWD
jgi:transcriptional regulator with XRE-family HTH domain